MTREQDLQSESTYATERANLPALIEPKSLEEVIAFCRAARQLLLAREGARNPFERGATMRDLQNIGAAMGLRLLSNRASSAVFEPVPAGSSGIGYFEDFAQKLRQTNLFKSLLKSIDDPTRFDNLPDEIKAMLLESLDKVAQERGADIMRMDQKVQDLSKSLASTSTTVTAAFDKNTAAVRQIQFAYANNTRAVAGEVITVTARLDDFDGGGATVEITMEAIADRATGLEAQYTIKVSAGGAMAGLGLAAVSPLAGPATSYLILVADNFAFVQPDEVLGTGPGEIDPTNPGSSRIPFAIDSDGVIYLTGQVRISANGPEITDLPLLSTSYSLISSVGALLRDTNADYVPATITFSAQSAVGTTGPSAYSGRFKIYHSIDGSTFTLSYTSSANESSKTYTPPVGKVAIKCELYLAGGTTTKIDETIVPVVDAGSNALTVTVTNPSQTVPSSSAGVVSSYTNTGTTIQVYEGATLLTFTTGTIGDGKYTCGTPAINPAGKITAGARSGNGTTTLTVADHSAMDNATDSVQITYPLTIQKADGTSVSWSAKQVVTKGKAGATGSSGTRGSLTGNGFQYGIRSGAWSDTLAQRVIENMNTGAVLTSGIAVGAMTAPGLVLGDQVTLGDGNPWWETLGAYAGGTTYDRNVIVISSGIAYRSLQTGNVGHTPVSSPTFWLSMGAINATGAWAAATAYNQNDTATSGGTTYLAKWKHTSDATALATDLATADVAVTRYWGGAAWLAPGVFIDGNLFVKYTISGDTLYGGTILGVSMNIGPAGEFQVDGVTGNVTAASFFGYASQFGNTINPSLHCITATTYAGGSGDAIRALVPYVSGASSGCALTAISQSDSGSSHAIKGTWDKFGTSADPGRATNNGLYSSGLVGANNGNAFYAVSGAVGPFTGSHECAVLPDLEFDPGDIVVDVALLLDNGLSNTFWHVEVSTEPRQFGAAGILTYVVRPLNETSLLAACPGPITIDDETGIASGPPEFEAIKDDYVLAQMNALGEGAMNVCGEGGLEVRGGDLIVTSSLRGKGMRQALEDDTSDDVIRSYTVAKVRGKRSVVYTFESATDWKTIPVFFVSG
jgi:hypothetical protein